MLSVLVPEFDPAVLDAAKSAYELQDWARAEAGCREVLRARPGDADALHLLGKILLRTGQTTFAVAVLRKAVGGAPSQAKMHATLGAALMTLGHLRDAESSLRQAVALDPLVPKPRRLLGAALYDQNQYDAAAEQFEQVLDHDPNDLQALLGLSIARRDLRQWDKALEHAQRALALAPSDPDVHVRLGGLALDLGLADQAVAYFRSALEIEPRLAWVQSNLVFTLHYLPGWDARALRAEAQAWAEQHAPPALRDSRPHTNTPDPERRLRIGYVSGDLLSHPVGYFLEGVLAKHDSAQVEVFCYSNNPKMDALTQKLRGTADHWRMINGFQDPSVAAAIRRDEIDILVDLSGHTGWHRLELFARKPAPVQVSWLGYFGTTGVAAIDHILVDEVICPSGDEGQFSELPVRLPGSYLCFAPRELPIAVGPPPALTRGHATFGCFNKIVKLTEPVVALWSEILRRVPDARLALKDAALDYAPVRERLTAEFAAHGVAADRLEFLGRSPYEGYLAAYQDVDVALDPFPFNGATTTSEALWMGVPVVTLNGDHFVGRMGASLLSAIGLSELVADTPSGYVDRACDLVTDLPRLTALRAGLRDQFLQSPLCDAVRFTHHLEAAYRTMWRTWCAESGVIEPRAS